MHVPGEVISIWGIREPLSVLSHLSGAVLALVGLAVLLRRANENGVPMRVRLGLIAFGCSMIFGFVASTLFHYFPWKPAELTFFKKLDHAAIFIVIGGTSTVLLNASRTRWRDALIVACWLVAAGALVLKMAVWPMSLWMSAAVYVTVGGIGAVSVFTALRRVPWRDLNLLVIGLVVYTVGAVIFATEAPVLWKGVIEGHELFHFMVLAGAAAHFIFVLRRCTVPDALGEGCAPTSRSV